MSEQENGADVGVGVREWTRSDIDRSGWGEGPWTREPDKIQWVDKATWLDCLMVRHPGSGHWCGYVGVGPDHPWHGKDYDADGVDVRVHGGLTFADACAESEDPAKGVCHIAEPGRPEHVWWFGFDCAHSGDYSPRDAVYAETHPIFARSWEDQYRDRFYVEREIRYLARQIAAQPSLQPQRTEEER